MTIRMPSATRFAGAPLLTGALILFIALYAGSFGAVAAHAGQGSSCHAMGTYGYTGFGTIFPGNAAGFPPGTASSNGTISLDGKGNVLIHEVEVIEGTVVSPPEAPRSLAPTRSILTAPLPASSRNLRYRERPWLAWSSTMAKEFEPCSLSPACRLTSCPRQRYILKGVPSN